MSKGKRDPDWIENGEKYALVGVTLNSDPDLGRLDLPGDLTVLANTAFKLPDHLREWLGTARVKNVEGCSLILLAKMPSNAPSVLDDENQLLQRRVENFFTGLTLASKFNAFVKPFWATGSRVADDIDVRRFGELDRPVGSIVEDDAPIGEQQLRKAAKIGNILQPFVGLWHPDHWRLSRCLGIFKATRTNLDMLDRIHQFTRCIEGLIASTKGETTRQFKTRTELFVGPSHGELMGDLYVARSDIEHLHEYRYLAAGDRPTRILLAKHEAVSEWIARSCLARILLDPGLMRHFGSASAQNQFWAKPKEERQTIWGPPVDPYRQLLRFNFDHVSDEQLGARRP